MKKTNNIPSSKPRDTENFEMLSPSNPFRVPGNYFEELENQILQKTIMNNSIRHLPGAVYLWRYSAAAVIVLSLVTSVFLLKHFLSPDLSQDQPFTVETYLLIDADLSVDISEEYLKLLLATENNDDINLLETSFQNDSTLVPAINEDNIMEFLLQDYLIGDYEI